jgi:hypothetical protein
MPRHQHTAARVTVAKPTVRMPAQMFPDGLFQQLTQDIQGGNEAGFLALVAPQARPVVKSWWDNLNALGFTSGAVVPTDQHDTVTIDSQGDGTAVILAGAHNALDPLDGSGKPDVPLERYRVGLHFTSPTATGQITSWQPLGGAPWDQGTQLYVRKAAHVVVAGLPGDSGVVDETLPLAEAAASYDIGLMNHVNYQILRQQGFVVFVSRTVGWLTATQQPNGWPATLLGARAYQLPGPGASQDTSAGGNGISTGTTGGARVVVTPFEQTGGTAHGETVTLVRDFMLDVLAAHDEEFVNGIPLDPVPSWAEQGLAVAVQGLFEASTNPAPARYSFGPLLGAVRSLPRAYRTGKLPNSFQLYGPDLNQDENWNDVAASVYAYIAQKYGMRQMLAAATLLYTQFPSPFGNVLKSQHNGTFDFYKSAVIHNGWRKWLAHL